MAPNGPSVASASEPHLQPSTIGTTTTTPPAPHAAAKDVVNDPARTGFDPQTTWWMNYFRILSGQMTKEGMFHYREWRYKVHEERDCKRCDEYRDWLFTYSPIVRFLNAKISDLNGKLDSSNVICQRCPARLDEDGQVHRQGGGFSPDHGIMLCANEIRDKKHLEDTLAHEMVHAWDHLRWKVDWAGDKDLKHAACTEVCMRYFRSFSLFSSALNSHLHLQLRLRLRLHLHRHIPFFIWLLPAHHCFTILAPSLPFPFFPQKKQEHRHPLFSLMSEWKSWWKSG